MNQTRQDDEANRVDEILENVPTEHSYKVAENPNLGQKILDRDLEL